MQIFLFQISSFFQLLFPFLYRLFGNLKDLMGRFQAMSCLSIFYCAFPISFGIVHDLILLVAIPFFNCFYYKRSHWGIENKLHWVLDMQFREDESRARADNSAENLNVLRHWAYNLLKAQSSLKGSFSDKQFKCLLDEAFLDEVIVSALCS